MNIFEKFTPKDKRKVTKAYDKEKLHKICEQQIVNLKLEKIPVRQLIY